MSGAVMAFCGWLVGRAPGWEDYRRFSWVAATAGLVSACNVPASLDLSPGIQAWAARAELAFLAAFLCWWIAYLSAWASRPLTRLDRAVLATLLVTGALALVPGLVYGDTHTLRPVAWLGVVYRDPVATAFGTAVLALLAAGGLVLVLRTWQLGRLGAPWPRLHLACTAAVLALGLHDAALVAGAPLGSPYLLGSCFAIPLLIMGYAGAARFLEHALELQRLKAGLEEEVARRTAELARSQAALARSERLAILGQVSAGLAHEVNNPAAALTSDLRHLREELAPTLSPELLECLDDSCAAVDRITALASQLLVAGRTAASEPGTMVPVEVGQAAAVALKTVRPRVGDHVELTSLVPARLAVLARDGPLGQVLTNLVLNAAQAIPAGRCGRVTVAAEARGGRVLVTVEDDGEGMSSEVMERVFEPFFSTKPVGAGAGLGLAVSRALVEMMSGSLRYESRVGQGTRALLELAAPGASPAPPG